MTVAISEELRLRQIRAQYDNESITVYQAYNADIAKSAVSSQTFVSPPFKMGRMTWIKPSFLWMMYRSGWATKEGQEHILRIKLKREGFDWAVRHSCLSHFDPRVHSSYEEWKANLANAPVRVQWDPDRDLYLQPLEQRAIQIGLSGIAVEKYITAWIVEISDITEVCYSIKRSLDKGDVEDCYRKLPMEYPYKLAEDLKKFTGVLT
ncbi:DUF4291 domain-containing protein [Segetibacter sp. 3557_3]|uniref:DUF4291 domain-containing protein n=1 Tax=Segetibacter sp. 3557_3 TaxID=2547429 RepID=UPI0010587E0E|nr:DUF4291 domain-containing protein [Segetibacter sp. 3557_3]TDH23955.1 DUF4291 domain-containing protein [Segetibacter sp. 3557_3]